MGCKKLIHAVAGSGKTRMIIESIDPSKRNLIITYTENNQNVLKSRLISKFGSIPENTHVFGVFKFLYSFCFVPYFKKRPNGINFGYKKMNNFDNNTVDRTGRIIHNQLSKALLKGEWTYSNKPIKFDNSYLDRIDKFFDNIFIDECQDFESHDFDWMLSLSNLKANVYLLGDFYQKTYSTSKSGNKGKGIHSNFNKWINEFQKNEFEINTNSLSKSRRCPTEVCRFIQDKLNIEITSDINGGFQPMFIEQDKEIDTIMNNDSVMKLFFEDSLKYHCLSQNWGDSKGLEFESVCVVLNPTTYKLYRQNNLQELKTKTKAKLYVACTRTLGDLYFIQESKVSHFKK